MKPDQMKRLERWVRRLHRKWKAERDGEMKGSPAYYTLDGAVAAYAGVLRYLRTEKAKAK